MSRTIPNALTGWKASPKSKNLSNSSTRIDGEESPRLDRFGLPIRTAENFFPILPPNTELIGVNENTQQPRDHTSGSGSVLQEIRDALVKHVHLNFDIFDENGVEKVTTAIKHENGTTDDINSRKGPEPWKLKLLHKSPPVLSIENFFTPEECHTYKSIADPSTMSSSSTTSTSPSSLRVDSATFSPLAHSKRTSTTWYCYYSTVPTLLAKTKRLLSHVPLEHMEEPQVVRYRTGEEFSWHYDEIPSTQLDNGGQRIATLLVYLNTVEGDKGGGATVFRDLRRNGEGESPLAMKPVEGTALLFFPAFADGTPDDRTLHKGEIARDEKMIAQIWIHEGNYEASLPEGNRHKDAFDAVSDMEKHMGY